MSYAVIKSEDMFLQYYDSLHMRDLQETIQHVLDVMPKKNPVQGPIWSNLQVNI